MGSVKWSEVLATAHFLQVQGHGDKETRRRAGAMTMFLHRADISHQPSHFAITASRHDTAPGEPEVNEETSRLDCT